MKKIIILGGSRYYAKSVKKAKSLGYFTIVLDQNDDAYCQKIADKFHAINIVDYDEVLKLSQQEKIDAIVPLNDYGVFTAAYVSEKLNLNGIGTQIAEIVTNKARLRKLWDQVQGINPKYRICKNLSECEIAVQEIGLPVILKPAVSMGGSRGVIFLDNDDKLEKAYKFSTSFYHDKTILVEEYLEGTEHSAEVLVKNSKAYIIAISDKIKSPLPSRVDKNVIYPTIYTAEQLQKLQTSILSSVDIFGVENGCFHVECVTLANGEIKMFEVGARPGGGGTPDPIVPFLTGINLTEKYIKTLVGENPNLPKQVKYKKAVNYHFITPKPGRIKKMTIDHRLNDDNDVLDFDFFLQEGDVIKDIKTGSDRSGFIIVGADTRQEALNKGNKLESLIKIEYEEEK